MRQKVFVTGAIALALAVVGIYALDALKPGEESPAQIVLVRKAGMQSNLANYGDLRAKTAAGNVKPVAVNAHSMMVFGSLIPTLFTETFPDAYPEGSKFFFKGGPAADLAEKAQAFVDAAGALATAADAGDPAALDPLVGGLFASCGACHAAYRGSR